MLYAIITIVGGLLAASAFVVARKPNAQELIDKLTPYQGWIGICLFAWGVWMTIGFVLHLNVWLHVPVLWLATYLGLTAVNVGVGFLLGFGLLTKYVLSKSPAAMARGQELRQKLVGIQIPLGLTAMGLGVWTAVYHMILI
jgi:hypothetical protein